MHYTQIIIEQIATVSLLDVSTRVAIMSIAKACTCVLISV